MIHQEGGYPAEWFLKPFSEDLICSICLNVLNDPPQQCKLGHCFRGVSLSTDLECLLTGDYRNGKLNGHGESHGLEFTYVGDFCDGKYHGIGLETQLDGGSTYEGEWRNGMKHGNGKCEQLFVIVARFNA